MYISFYILAMIAFAVSLFGLLKNFGLNKKHMPLGRLPYHAENPYLVQEQSYGQPVSNKTGRLKNAVLKPDAVRIIRNILIGLAFFGLLLSLAGIARTFLYVPPDAPFGDNELQQLVNSKVTYSVHDDMRVEDEYHATAVITKNQCERILFNKDDSSKTAKCNNSFSCKVSVSLVDPLKKCFVIHPLNQQDQIVDNNDPYTWRWKVKPVKSGKNDIVLRVTIKSLNDSAKDRKDICFFKTITVTPRQ